MDVHPTTLRKEYITLKGRRSQYTTHKQVLMSPTVYTLLSLLTLIEMDKVMERDFGKVEMFNKGYSKIITYLKVSGGSFNQMETIT